MTCHSSCSAGNPSCTHHPNPGSEGRAAMEQPALELCVPNLGPPCRERSEVPRPPQEPAAELTQFALPKLQGLSGNLSSPKGTNLFVADFTFFSHLFLSEAQLGRLSVELMRISKLAQGERAAPPCHHRPEFVLNLFFSAVQRSNTVTRNKKMNLSYFDSSKGTQRIYVNFHLFIETMKN